MISDFGFRISDLKNPRLARRVGDPSHRQITKSPNRQIGFTLVEMLVVIVIIAILLGIGLLVGPEVLGTGNKQATVALLNNCQAILDEYQTRVGSPVNNFGNNPIDWSTSKSQTWGGSSHTADLSISSTNDFPVKSIEQFVYATYKIDDIRTKLYSGAAFKVGNTSLLGDSDADGMLDLVDTWGNKIVYVAPNCPANYEMPVRSFAYFASAGPDGNWGPWNTNTNADQPDTANENGVKWDANADKTPDAADNLYTFSND